MKVKIIRDKDSYNLDDPEEQKRKEYYAHLIGIIFKAEQSTSNPNWIKVFHKPYGIENPYTIWDKDEVEVLKSKGKKIEFDTQIASRETLFESKNYLCLDFPDDSKGRTGQEITNLLLKKGGFKVGDRVHVEIKKVT